MTERQGLGCMDALHAPVGVHHGTPICVPCMTRQAGVASLRNTNHQDIPTHHIEQHVTKQRLDCGTVMLQLMLGGGPCRQRGCMQMERNVPANHCCKCKDKKVEGHQSRQCCWRFSRQGRNPPCAGDIACTQPVHPCFISISRHITLGSCRRRSRHQRPWPPPPAPEKGLKCDADATIVSMLPMVATSATRPMMTLTIVISKERAPCGW